MSFFAEGHRPWHRPPVTSDWIRLERSLHRRQKAAISEALGPRPKANLAYEARYHARARKLAGKIDRAQALDPAELRKAISKADVVFVGDYLTFPESQRAFARLVERACGAERPPVMAVQACPVAAQGEIDAFVKGRISERTLRRRLGLDEDDLDVRWRHLRPLLELARDRRVEILALDEQTASLRRWDLRAASRIARRARAADRPRVFVLAGEFHLAPAHLPGALGEAAPDLERLSLYQRCDPVYWARARRGVAAQAITLRLGKDELCRITGSPVESDGSFLDLLESEEGDWLLEGDPTPAVGALAAGIARAVGLSAGARGTRPEIATRIAPALAAARRARFSATEREHLAHHILSRESGYFPRAELIWLATRSAHHAAEEATHWLRHRTVGPALLARRAPARAFYTRCVEEALGFFGSRLVNPHRPVRTLEAWAAAFRRGEDARAAAFVLAHKAAESEGHAPPLPKGDLPLFHAVTHGLGYLLGDALHDAHVRGDLGRKRLGAIFRDPLKDPRAAYFELSQSVQLRA